MKRLKEFALAGGGRGVLDFGSGAGSRFLSQAGNLAVPEYLDSFGVPGRIEQAIERPVFQPVVSAT